MFIKTENALKNIFLSHAIAVATLASPIGVQADFLDELFKDSKGYGNLRLRYEDAEVGSNSDDALTLRTLVGLKTGIVSGFSAVVEFEDVREVLGMGEEANGFNIIADVDDENTELEQAFVQYKDDIVAVKVGRQVLTLDGHRHVGHVGWRQDWQTFDAGRVTVTPVKNLAIDVSYIYKVNRINSPMFADIPTASGHTSHKLVNASYQTSVGKVVAYYYDLSEESYGGPDGQFDATETLGLSFSGKTGDDIKLHYTVEYAMQDNVSEDLETEYSLVELGATVAGVTAKAGWEVLGSDTKAGGDTENFQTPLATVHKFQGWADVFLGGSLWGEIDGGNGVEDIYFSVGGKVAGTKLQAIYHDYDSESGPNDLGDEINLLAVRNFGERYSVGLKYADYSKGDTGSDVTRFWTWIQVKI